jgi:hypothetical protein
MINETDDKGNINLGIQMKNSIIFDLHSRLTKVIIIAKENRLPANLACRYFLSALFSLKKIIFV